MTSPLQRYQIMEPLGHGGQGHTYRAIDRASGEAVAVKVLGLRNLREWKGFDLFEREVATLRGLSHPAIPRYRDRYASERTGDYFLVMDLVQGRSLRDLLLSKTRMDRATWHSVFAQALDVLEYLHGLTPPVIHRDIKPANLILDQSGQLHLVDFGGVRLALRPEGGSTVVGTFGYMAPEQLHGEATPATDIYGLGATMAALEAGVEAERLPRKGLRIDLESVVPSHGLRALLMAMTEPDPDHRLGTVSAVRVRLDRESTPRATGGPGSDRPHQPDQALVPTEIVELAKVPAPFSIVVWLMAAIAAGTLTLVEVVLLPLVLWFMQTFARRRSNEAHQRPEDPLAELEDSVRTGRRTMQYLASATHPTRDDPPDRDPDREDSSRSSRGP